MYALSEHQLLADGTGLIAYTDDKLMQLLDMNDLELMAVRCNLCSEYIVSDEDVEGVESALFIVTSGLEG